MKSRAHQIEPSHFTEKHNPVRKQHRLFSPSLESAKLDSISKIISLPLKVSRRIGSGARTCYGEQSPYFLSILKIMAKRQRCHGHQNLAIWLWLQRRHHHHVRRTDRPAKIRFVLGAIFGIICQAGTSTLNQPGQIR